MITSNPRKKYFLAGILKIRVIKIDDNKGGLRQRGGASKLYPLPYFTEFKWLQIFLFIGREGDRG